jgi:endonuclease/exonuclease/phosphatase family metal-dependent hydrolase
VNGWEGHGYHSRLLNIDTCWETLQPFLKKYPEASVLFGCDYNAAVGSDEVKKIEGLGFKDCHDLAENTDNDCSSHGYPTYDTELGYFVTPNISNAPYTASIDHIFQYGNTITPTTYDTILTTYSALFSDHAPVLLDFDITKK